MLEPVAGILVVIDFMIESNFASKVLIMVPSSSIFWSIFLSTMSNC